jgi:formiminoglutamate deiminase
MTQYVFCDDAWLGGERPELNVLIGIEDGLIVSVTADAEPPSHYDHVHGMTIPGLANAHSHAFQRGLRGRTHGGTGSFWTWREQMYALAERIDPDNYLALARATFAEMAMAGITLVGEFHYVHHDPGGTPYADPNALGAAVVQAAAEAGVRLTLIDACYLHGGIGEEPEGAQRRFCDADVDAWLARVDALRDGERVKIAAAIHSVRAVDPQSAAEVAAWTARDGRPLHAHVSEQPAENAACKHAYGGTPTAVLETAGALTERFTAVHATHLTDDDVARLGGARATICLCPTTERDLADGVGPAKRLAEVGAALAVGSDSQAVIDLFEEARAIELDERLATGVRGHHRGIDLLRAATAGGYASLGWPGGGVIAPGAPADLVTIGFRTPRLAGASFEHSVDTAVFAATADDVMDVMVGGEWIVRTGRHVRFDVHDALREALMVFP